MKICHMTSAHAPKDSRIFYRECISLANAGYQTYLVAPGEYMVEQEVIICGVGKPYRNRLKRMILMTKKVYKKALEIDADIYHIHDPELLPFAMKLKRCGKTVIFDSHENVLKQIQEKTYIPKVIRGLTSRYLGSFYKKTFKCMDAIITVDSMMEKEYLNLSGKVVIVANYPPYQKICQKSRPTNEVFTVCFAGGISPQWNHETIIRAIEPIENIRYIMCGEGDCSYINQLKSMPGWDKVDYRGLVTYESALRFLSESDMGIALCSYSNNTNGKKGTLGNTKLFEIMMMDLPLLCTDFEVWKNIIETNQCGICVSPTDVAAVRAGIIYFMNHRTEATKMGKCGNCAVEKMYNWERENEKLLELYRELESRLMQKGTHI